MILPFLSYDRWQHWLRLDVVKQPGFCSHYYCADYEECKYSDTFWLADRVRLFVPYTISLSSLCKLIWGHWTYEMPVRYILSNVWVRLSLFSQLSIIQYIGLCVFSVPISLVIIESIYTLSYYHHQIGNMNYYPLFRVRSWNNGMRFMSLYILRSLIEPGWRGSLPSNGITRPQRVEHHILININLDSIGVSIVCEHCLWTYEKT